MTVLAATQYEELVVRGREARQQADDMQWIEGDLALNVEALPPHERPRDAETGDFVPDPERALKRYAQDVDINYRTLQSYRLTAERWPVRARAGASWRTHYQLNSQDDRFHLIHDGMTVSEAEKLVRDRTAGNQGKPGWLELIGQIGDDLTKALKDLDKFDASVGEKAPTENVRAKAGRFAGRAEEIAARLQAIEAA